MITLTVNGRAVEVNDGLTLLDASREAGVYIPTLCYYPRLCRQAGWQWCGKPVAFEISPTPDAADVNDLTVVTPTGERCRFSMKIETLQEGSQSRMLIRNLVREVL